MAYGYAVYFTERAKNRIIRWEPDTGTAEVIAGEPKDGDPAQMLKSPYGLAFDSNGHLLIADKLKHRICRLRNGRLEPLQLLDPNGHRARKPRTPRGYSETPITPTGLFMEGQGTLLCTFVDENTVYRVHENGHLEHVVGIVPNRMYFSGSPKQDVPLGELAETALSAPTGVVSRKDGTIFFIERFYQVVREFHPGRGLRAVFPTSLIQEFADCGDAPLQSSLDSYHPGYPGALALDKDDSLYMTDIKHRAILHVDFSNREIRRVASFPATQGLQRMGPAALTFGPDGTAWVLNTAFEVVEGYRPTPSGQWATVPERLAQFQGKLLELPDAGSGIVTGV